jgi:hypothetical protein
MSNISVKDSTELMMNLHRDDIEIRQGRKRKSSDGALDVHLRRCKVGSIEQWHKAGSISLDSIGLSKSRVCLEVRKILEKEHVEQSDLLAMVKQLREMVPERDVLQMQFNMKTFDFAKHNASLDILTGYEIRLREFRLLPGNYN